MTLTMFTLNAFFGALIFFLLLEWRRTPQRTWLVLAFGLASGLASTNQQTIALLAPA